MIYVDDRIGSKEFATAIKKVGIQTEVTRMDAGDFAFSGNGPDGDVLVGVERKTVGDMMNSIRSGRFSSTQLPAMCNLYDKPYLLIEGSYRRGPFGLLEVWKEKGLMSGWQDLKLGKVSQAFVHAELAKFLMTVQNCTPIKVIHSANESETVHTLAMLYHWWQKEWALHKSHQALDTTQFIAIRPKLIRLVAAQLRGVGWHKSRAFAKRYKSVYDLVMAGPSDISKCEGVGKVLAARVYNALRGKE